MFLSAIFFSVLEMKKARMRKWTNAIEWEGTGYTHVCAWIWPFFPMCRHFAFSCFMCCKTRTMLLFNPRDSHTSHNVSCVRLNSAAVVLVRFHFTWLFELWSLNLFRYVFWKVVSFLFYFIFRSFFFCFAFTFTTIVCVAKCMNWIRYVISLWIFANMCMLNNIIVSYNERYFGLNISHTVLYQVQFTSLLIFLSSFSSLFLLHTHKIFALWIIIKHRIIHSIWELARIFCLLRLAVSFVDLLLFFLDVFSNEYFVLWLEWDRQRKW